MDEETNDSAPPQIAYFFVFSLGVIFLAISMVRYPLWGL
jgi:hypothetical protein